MPTPHRDATERSVPSTRDFQFIGGSLALDFVNTVGNRLGEARDYFLTPHDVVRWAGMLSCPPHLGSLRIRHSDMAGIRSRREYLYALFLGFAQGKKRRRIRELARLNLDIGQLWAKKTLRRNGARVHWTFEGIGVERLAHAVVSDAADVLSSGRCELIRQCQDRSCGWLYIDRSREQNRRWCSMRDCGNRAKARRFYAQHHREGAA